MRNQRIKKRKRSNLPLLLLLFAAATLVTAGLLYFSKGESEDCLINYEGEHLDERAEKIKQHFWERNERNKEGDFSYEMETHLVFKGEDEECRINLANPHRNTYLMYAELSLKDDERVFLRTGLLRPGEKIVKITPDEKLPLGTYEGWANICAVDPDTEEFIGFLEQEIEIEVRN